MINDINDLLYSTRQADPDQQKILINKATNDMSELLTAAAKNTFGTKSKLDSQIPEGNPNYLNYQFNKSWFTKSCQRSRKEYHEAKKKTT